MSDLHDSIRNEQLSHSEDEPADREVDSSIELRKEAEAVYTPLNEKDQVELTMSRVRQFIATPTASGRLPSDSELINFIQICKLRRLNPWCKDAFLIGYDERNHKKQIIGAKFSTIVAYQALTKRAEGNENYDGIEAGVIVEREGDFGQQLDGTFSLPTDKLVGAWSRVFRKDRSRPYFCSIVREAFDKKRSRWKDDPNGMLVKCAKAAGLREQFPNDLGGMYIHEEMPEEQPAPAERVRREDLRAVPLTADDGEVIEEDEVQVSNLDEQYLTLTVRAFYDAATIHECGELEGKLLDDSELTDKQVAIIKVSCEQRLAQIRSERGERSNDKTTLDIEA